MISSASHWQIWDLFPFHNCFSNQGRGPRWQTTEVHAWAAYHAPFTGNFIKHWKKNFHLPCFTRTSRGAHFPSKWRPLYLFSWKWFCKSSAAFSVTWRVWADYVQAETFNGLQMLINVVNLGFPPINTTYMRCFVTEACLLRMPSPKINCEITCQIRMHALFMRLLCLKHTEKGLSTLG